MLRDMRAEMATKDELAAVKQDLADLRAEMRSDMHSLRADVASDIATVRAELKAEIRSTRNDLSDQIDGVRRMVTTYHSSVPGHGVLISDLDARVRRVEQHLNLPAIDPH